MSDRCSTGRVAEPEPAAIFRPVRGRFPQGAAGFPRRASAGNGVPPSPNRKGRDTAAGLLRTLRIVRVGLISMRTSGGSLCGGAGEHGIGRAQALAAAGDLLNANSVVSVHYDEFSGRDHLVVDDDLHRIVNRAIEFDDFA